MRLIRGWDAAVARWVGDRLDIKEFGPFYRAVGIANDCELIGGVVYNNYRHPNIEMTIATATPRWCSRSILRILFWYPFNTFDCRRVTAVTESTNQPARAFLCRLGFHEEGTMRRAFPSGADAAIYGMLREECRWLGEEAQQHVQRRRERTPSDS